MNLFSFFKARAFFFVRVFFCGLPSQRFSILMNQPHLYVLTAE